MIGIIDYGAGNLQSVRKALDYIGAESRIASRADDLEGAGRIVLPGVGAFGAAAAGLEERGFTAFLREWIRADRPFLGICLGLQLLFEGSTESAGAAGLGFFKGTCLRFKEGKVPQIGWNQVSPAAGSRMFDGIADGTFFYFLHGYYAAPGDETWVAARTTYGVTFASAVQRGRIWAVQFHPEKSGDAGLQLLRNWEARCLP
jgi:imidazole glycerol phosphate synthase glutamine amidotransferase subunit